MPVEAIDKYINVTKTNSIFSIIQDKARHYIADGKWADVLLPFLVNVAFSVVIYVLGIWIARKLLLLVDKVLIVRGFDAALRGFLQAVFSLILKFVVVLVAIEQVGIDTSSLLALLGAAGLAVGLALKDSLSNFASGVLLILLKPFSIGDFIEAAGVSARVEKITIFNTVLKTGDNREVIVPNSQIYGGTITNFSSQENRRIDLLVGVSYEADIKRVRGLIYEILENDSRILKDPAVIVAISELADNSVNFIVRPWVKTPDYWDVRWHLLETIKITFDENKISIPYPQRTIHIQNNEK